ncbi:MAG: UV DNA damage repair endonuclease UvsE [Gemmatimonadaceae bacterium]
MPLTDRPTPRPIRHLGFAVKVLGTPGLKSNDARRWQSGPHLRVSIEYLARIFEYCDGIDVRMYRMSSDIAPYATHPTMPQFHDQVRECADDLAALGARARELGLRLSLHPSQYIVLNSPNPAVARGSARDLEVQTEILDAMEQGPEATVIVHGGGGYGDKVAALDRFCRAWEGLSERARSRIAVENDEDIFSVEDTLGIHRRTGAKTIFDHQHHRLNPGTWSGREADAANASLATWPDGVTPKLHYSSPRLDAREVTRGGKAKPGAPLLSQHADYIDPWTFDAFARTLRRPVDVMLEAKAKDLALLRLRKDLAMLDAKIV